MKRFRACRQAPLSLPALTNSGPTLFHTKLDFRESICIHQQEKKKGLHFPQIVLSSSFDVVERSKAGSDVLCTFWVVDPVRENDWTLAWTEESLIFHFGRGKGNRCLAFQLYVRPLVVWAVLARETAVQGSTIQQNKFLQLLALGDCRTDQ